MVANDKHFIKDATEARTLHTSLRSAVTLCHTSLIIPGIAQHCKDKKTARSEPVSKRIAQDLATATAESISARLGSVWKPADSTIATFPMEDTSAPDSEMSASLCMLLFHISAFLDISKCVMKCLQCPNNERNALYETFCAAVAREIRE